MRTAVRQILLGRPAFDFYVDSVNGSDSNRGTNPNSAFKNLTALPTIQNGKRIGLARGSNWQQFLQIGATTAVADVLVAAYGFGAQPVIDGADQIAAGNWSKTGGLTSTYNTTAAVTFPNGQSRISKNFTPWVNAQENGVFLTYLTTQAAVDAAPGSYTTTDMTQNTGTVYVHASDGSNPATNGKTYTYTARPFSIQIAATGGVRITNVHTKNNGSLLGSIQLNGDGSAPYLGYCTIDNGSKHNAIAAAGGIVEYNTFNEAYYPSSQSSATNMLVFFETTGSGKDCTARYNIFNFSTATATVNTPTAIYAHTAAGSLGALNYLYNNVTVTGNLAFTAFDGNNATAMNVVGGLVLGVTAGWGATIPTVVTGAQLVSSNTLGVRAAQINAGADGHLTMTNCKLCVGNVNQGIVRNALAGANVVLTGNAFYASASTFFRSHIWSADVQWNVTANGNTFDSDTNMFACVIGNGAPTYVGNNNSFGHASDWNINNISYSTLAAWQAATSQDAASNTNTTGNGPCSY